MKKIIKNPWFLLIVIFLIASFLRFYDITKTPPGFYPDEAINANNGVEAWETGHLKVFYPENNGREGLWMNIVGFFVFKFGHEPWIPRAVAAMFGLFTVLGVYFLTKELFSRKIALLSSFFIATSFWHINFSRISFRAILAPAFLVWGLFFLLKTLNQAKNNSQSPIHDSQTNWKLEIKNWLLPLLAGAVYGLGFHTYIAYRVTPVLILAIILFYWFGNKEKSYRQKIIIPIACFLISALMVAAPLLWYFLKNPQDFLGRTSQISVFSSPSPVKTLGMNILKTAGMFNFAGDSNWRHNYPSQPELFWPVGVLFLFGSFLGIRSMIKKTKIMEFAVLFGWLALAALPVIISDEGLPHALRAILMIPPILILAGIGGICLYKFLAIKIKNQGAFNIFVFIFLSLLFFEAYTTYFILWGQNPNTAGAFNQNYVVIGQQLNALPKELPKYVIVKASGALVRSIPMPAETVIFITDTFTPEKQKEKNIFYILPEQVNQIPPGAFRIELN
ncbi:MAG: glycosyltransferase family 39 protein [bacterium]|nr:glycosyltransferase family 39 protein [bacterium]